LLSSSNSHITFRTTILFVNKLPVGREKHGGNAIVPLMNLMGLECHAGAISGELLPT